jgi:hypothetical protein
MKDCRRTGSAVEFDRVANAFGDYLGEAAVQVVAITVVNPSRTGRVEVVVPRARAGGEPNLVGGSLAAQYKLAAFWKFHRDDAIAGSVIDLVRIQCFEPFSDPAKTLIGPPQIFLLIHASTLAEYLNA